MAEPYTDVATHVRDAAQDVVAKTMLAEHGARDYAGCFDIRLRKEAELELDHRRPR